MDEQRPPIYDVHKRRHLSQVDGLAPTSATARELHALIVAAAQGQAMGGSAEDLKVVHAGLMPDLGHCKPQAEVREPVGVPGTRESVVGPCLRPSTNPHG